MTAAAQFVVWHEMDEEDPTVVVPFETLAEVMATMLRGKPEDRPRVTDNYQRYDDE